MATTMSTIEFATLAKQTGIPFTDAQRDGLHEAYGLLEHMLTQVRKTLPPELEPATVFRAGDVA